LCTPPPTPHSKKKSVETTKETPDNVISRIFQAYLMMGHAGKVVCNTLEAIWSDTIRKIYNVNDTPKKSYFTV
jgi:hypothetical protein